MCAFSKSIAVYRTMLIGCLCVFFSVSPAFSKEAVLKNIEIGNAGSHLVLSFDVAGCFTENMKKAIENGMNTTFNFFIRVYEVRDLWWDKKISDIKINHDVQYDSLKKVYMIRLFENGDKPLFVRDFSEVKKRMSAITGLRLARLEDLRKGAHYQVRLMAELDKIRLPLNLHNVFFFLSLWDFETDWYMVDFTY